MATRKLRKSIGIIVPTASSQFHENFLDSFTTECLKREYQTTIILTHNDLSVEKNAINTLSKISDALVITSCAKDYNEIKDCIPKTIPAIFLLNKPKDCPHTCILESDFSAIYQGVISCSNRGFSKMAFVCSTIDDTFTLECLKAFQSAVDSFSQDEFDESCVYEVGNPFKYDPKKLLNKLSNEGYKAIFAPSPAITKSLVDSLMIYNSKVSDETSIVLLGYSTNTDLLSSHLYVDIIEQPSEEIVSLTAQQVFYHIAHPRKDEGNTFLLKGTLRLHRVSGWL